MGTRKRAHLWLLRLQIEGQMNNEQVKPKGDKILQQENLIEIQLGTDSSSCTDH